MIKEFKENPSLLAIIVFAFMILLSAIIHSFKNNEKLTEQDYYNKFCTKYYDVSCDNIKIK